MIVTRIIQNATTTNTKSLIKNKAVEFTLNKFSWFPLYLYIFIVKVHDTWIISIILLLFSWMVVVAFVVVVEVEVAAF